MFQCDKCKKSYKQKKHLYDHQRAKHTPGGEVRHTCPKCGASYAWEANLKEHLKKGGCNKRKHMSTDNGSTNNNGSGSRRCPTCSRIIRGTYEDYAKHSHSHVKERDLRQCLNKNKAAIEKKNLVHKPGACDSYNFPLAVNESISPGVIAEHLNEIYEKAGSKFKVQMGVGRILRNVENNELKYWKAEHDQHHVLLKDSEQVVKPMKINSRKDIEEVAQKASELADEDYLKTGRPDTKWELVMPTNIRYYVSYTGFVTGVFEGKHLPGYIYGNKNIVALHKNKHGKYYEDHLCFFRCLAYHKLKTNSRALEELTLHLVEQWKAYKRDQEAGVGVELQDFVDLENCFDINIEVYQLKKNSRKSNTYAVHIYKSQDVAERGTIKLNLYTLQDVSEFTGMNGHLSYISNIKAYTSVYHCVKCDRDFKDAFHLHRHEKICKSGVPEEKFVGGYKKLKMTLWERLESYGISVPDRYCRDFIVFDCESILRPIPDNEGETAKRRWTAEHVPVSIAMTATFMPQDPLTKFPQTECIVSRDPQQLVREFLARLMDWRKRIVEETKKKYKPVTLELKQLMADITEKENALFEELSQQQDLQDLQQQDLPPYLSDLPKSGNVEPLVWCRSLLQDLQNLESDLKKYMEQVAVLGYNSAKYDINLLKEYLIVQFLSDYAQQDDKEPIKVIKQQASYSALELGHYLKFLDVYKYQSPSCTLDSFMKAEGVVDTNNSDKSVKSYFPYEWFDSYDKLDYPGLPPPGCWFSTLKGYNVLGKSDAEINKNYEICQKKLMEISPRNPKFQHFLVFYNSMDVGPMLVATQRWLAYYIEENQIDVLKDTMSLPGIARLRMYRAASRYPHFMGFSLTDPKHPNLEKLIVDNLCGGPSQIFTRHHEAGKTLIRPSQCDEDEDHNYVQHKKTCQGVLGYDASSLYPYCLTKPLPVGPPAHYELYRPEEGFMLGNHFQASMAGSWPSQLQMNYCCSLDSSYQHLWNTGKEVRIGNFRVDAYSASKNEIIEVAGCYWHSHGCQPGIVRSPEQIARYERTVARAQFIEEVTGIKVKLVWECQIQRHIKDRRPPVYLELKKRVGHKIMSQGELLAIVKTGKFFGAVEVDIEVPDSLKEKLSEFAPLFVTCEIPMTCEVIGEHMYKYVEEQHLSLKPRKQLVAGLKARQILLATPLLQWYLLKGLKVTRVYQAIEWNSQPCLQKFFESVAQDRRQASGDPSREAHAAKQKLTANSAYGATLLNKLNYTHIHYVGENEALLKHNDPRFRLSSEIVEGFYEVQMAHKQIVHDIPKQVGFFVLMYAKLRMLEFYYDCLDYYLNREDYELVQMDTDSIYFAVSYFHTSDSRTTSESLSSHPLLPLVKSGKLDEFVMTLYNYCDDDWEPDFNKHYFPRQCCQKHNVYDQKTPGLFKLEKSGVAITGLCSKTYCLKLCDGGEKSAVKGVNKSKLQHTYERMNQVLQSGKTQEETNMGFRMDSRKMKTYEENKKAFNYLYLKRQVLPDGIHTKPLNLILEPKHSTESIQPGIIT